MRRSLDIDVDGPPIRLSDLAALTGFTRHKLYADIERGHLDAVAVRCGKSRYWVISRPAARRYVSEQRAA